jgi:hypothetical protein
LRKSVSRRSQRENSSSISVKEHKKDACTLEESFSVFFGYAFPPHSSSASRPSPGFSSGRKRIGCKFETDTEEFRVDRRRVHRAGACRVFWTPGHWQDRFCGGIGLPVPIAGPGGCAGAPHQPACDPYPDQGRSSNRASCRIRGDGHLLQPERSILRQSRVKTWFPVIVSRCAEKRGIVSPRMWSAKM